MSVPSSKWVVGATTVLAILVSALWIDDGPLASFSVGRRNVRREDSDYVYLLQSQPLQVESGSTAFVVDGNGAAEPTQQLAQTNQAVSSARVVVAAAGPPAEPVLEAEVVPFPQTVDYAVASPRTSMHMAGFANYNKFIEYLQLGSTSMGFQIWYVAAPVLMILALLSVLCIYSVSQKGITPGEELYQRKSPDQARSRRFPFSPAQYHHSAHDKPVHEQSSMLSEATPPGHSYPTGETPSPLIANESPVQRPNIGEARKRKPPAALVRAESCPSSLAPAGPTPHQQAPVSMPPSTPGLTAHQQAPVSSQRAPVSTPGFSALVPTPAPSLLADTVAPDIFSACTAVPASLCSQLALPACEGRFAVPVQALTDINKGGSIDITGNSGIRFFVLRVKQVGGLRVLHISLSSRGSAPRVTIGPPASGLRADRALEIRSGGQDASLYGALLPRPNGEYDVVQNGQIQMTLGDQAGDAQLQVKNVDGQIIASITSSSEGFGGVLHLVTRIHPSVDPVLTLACMFAVIVLC